MKGVAILLLLVAVTAAYQYQFEEDEMSCSGENWRDRCDYEPCSWSSCPMMGASCRNNYCGGCHARWYDSNGRYCHMCSRYMMY